jgi:hypothetical protein
MMKARRMQRSRTIRQYESQREGVAATEFAIVLPLFLTLVLGILEIGRSLETSTTMYASLREAGRLASLDYTEVLPSGTTANEKIIQDIRNFLKASGLPGDDFTITITHADGESEGATFDLMDADNKLQLFKLSADIDYSDISIFPFKFMTGQTLRSSLVFRMGRVTQVN